VGIFAKRPMAPIMANRFVRRPKSATSTRTSAYLLPWVVSTYIDWIIPTVSLSRSGVIDSFYALIGGLEIDG
jgi:hypothetical protein